jgi:RNA polymerase-binding transcription factor DksA
MPGLHRCRDLADPYPCIEENIMNSFATKPVLTTEQLSLFAAQLDQQRRFRIEQLHDHAVASGVRPQTPVEREISDTLQRGARQALAEIDSARARLSDGSYGRCVDCGCQLPIERLEVLPHVPRCMTCHRAAAG